jgi:adenylate kinase
LLVPDEVVAKVIEGNLNSKGFVLDGYPRNLNQAKTLDGIFKKNNINYDVFVNIYVDEQTIINRLSKRRVCKQCGAIYHLVNMPPQKEGICDKCAGALIQRDDDKPEVIKKRWEVFQKESKQVLDFYKTQKKFLEVDGCENKEKIFEAITKKIGQ